MRRINKPIIKAKNVFLDCIDNMRDTALKNTLTSSVNVIEDAETEFESKKNTNTLHTISKNKSITGVNSDVLKKVYENRMVNQENKGRKHYDVIRLSAPNGKCPLCSQRTVSTLDHYLPKAFYPLLSVTPINLIPSCSDCNKGKLGDSPTKSKEETLHPYYDDVESFSWLKMQLITVNPLVVKFYVSCPQEIETLLQQRIQYHFEKFKLNELFVPHAIVEFVCRKKQFENLYQNGGTTALTDFLEESYESIISSYYKNSWQTAFYEGLLNNEEFCNGGFIDEKA